MLYDIKLNNIPTEQWDIFKNEEHPWKKKKDLILQSNVKDFQGNSS